MVLKGADNTLNKYKPTIFVETHTEELLQNCIEYLGKKGYKLKLLRIQGKNKKQIYAYTNP